MEVGEHLDHHAGTKRAPLQAGDTTANGWLHTLRRSYRAMVPVGDAASPFTRTTASPIPLSLANQSMIYDEVLAAESCYRELTLVHSPMCAGCARYGLLTIPTIVLLPEEILENPHRLDTEAG